jgi:hypothetical protein
VVVVAAAAHDMTVEHGCSQLVRDFRIRLAEAESAAGCPPPGSAPSPMLRSPGTAMALEKAGCAVPGPAQRKIEAVAPEKAGCTVPGPVQRKIEVVALEAAAADTRTADGMPGSSRPRPEVARAGDAEDSEAEEAADAGSATHCNPPTW